jgi:hypothetical protein
LEEEGGSPAEAVVPEKKCLLAIGIGSEPDNPYSQPPTVPPRPIPMEKMLVESRSISESEFQLVIRLTTYMFISP